mmetsp:Transcript_33876/g.46374  ORF Transcript_33876/g.46374 Transcript_33876/m.46374 type:complete len:223 (+) Transcript_33876:44-712(+)
MDEHQRNVTESEVPQPSKFLNVARKAWISSLRLSAIVLNCLLPVYCVLGLIGHLFDVVTLVLHIYIALLSSLCLACELRFISFIRRIAYPILRWIYFLTFHETRGAFYIFLGTLMCKRSSAISLVFAVALMVVGLLWIVLNRLYQLDYPVDSQIKQSLGEVSENVISQETMEKTFETVLTRFHKTRARLSKDDSGVEKSSHSSCGESQNVNSSSIAVNISND